MQRYIAFHIYTLKPHGGHIPACPDRRSKDVYLADDVDTRIAEAEAAMGSVLMGNLAPLAAYWAKHQEATQGKEVKP